jgi:hypothetical protein
MIYETAAAVVFATADYYYTAFVREKGKCLHVGSRIKLLSSVELHRVTRKQARIIWSHLILVKLSEWAYECRCWIFAECRRSTLAQFNSPTSTAISQFVGTKSLIPVRSSFSHSKSEIHVHWQWKSAARCRLTPGSQHLLALTSVFVHKLCFIFFSFTLRKRWKRRDFFMITGAAPFIIVCRLLMTSMRVAHFLVRQTLSFFRLCSRRKWDIGEHLGGAQSTKDEERRNFVREPTNKIYHTN